MNDIVSQIVLKQSITIELSLAGGAIARGNFYKFPSNYIDKVRDKIVTGLEFVPAEVLSTSPTNRPVVALVNAPNMTLDVVEAGTNLKFVDTFPATRLIPSLYNGYTQALKPRRLDFTNTGVRIQAVGTIANTQSVMLLVYYRDATPEELRAGVKKGR